ncbi:hypothetical protein Q8A73_000874 [Channa argus]|nr:hypothetical protein Q8A73_000874 [Channa argus]
MGQKKDARQAGGPASRKAFTWKPTCHFQHTGPLGGKMEKRRKDVRSESDKVKQRATERERGRDARCNGRNGSQGTRMQTYDITHAVMGRRLAAPGADITVPEEHCDGNKP